MEQEQDPRYMGTVTLPIDEVKMEYDRMLRLDEYGEQEQELKLPSGTTVQTWRPPMEGKRRVQVGPRKVSVKRNVARRRHPRLRQPKAVMETLVIDDLPAGTKCVEVFDDFVLFNRILSSHPSIHYVRGEDGLADHSIRPLMEWVSMSPNGTCVLHGYYKHNRLLRQLMFTQRANVEQCTQIPLDIRVRPNISWAPDESCMVFPSSLPTDLPDVYRLTLFSVPGGQITTLRTCVNKLEYPVRSFRWSADSQRIVTRDDDVDAGGNDAFIVMNRQGHVLVRLLSSGQFSADGNYLLSLRRYVRPPRELEKGMLMLLPQQRHSTYAVFDKWAIIPKWTDCTHHLFGPAITRPVFVLMCVKQRLEQTKALPRLPMDLWLMLFESLYFSLSTD